MWVVLTYHTYKRVWIKLFAHEVFLGSAASLAATRNTVLLRASKDTQNAEPRSGRNVVGS